MSDRPIVTESIEDATGTSACDACDGRIEGCDECYRGRVAGYRDTGRVRHGFLYDELDYETVPCTPEQRAAVDHYLDDCDTPCSLCGRPIPNTSTYPICARCTATAVAHAQLERDRREWDRERGAA